MNFIRTFAVFLCLAALASSGCRLCGDCDLDAFPTYGGAWQREHRDSGRVGSIFDPGGSRMADLTRQPSPETADAYLRAEESDREKQEKRDSEAEDESEIEQQFRENRDTKPKTEAEEERELKEMEERFERLELEDIRKIVVPKDDDWR